MQNIDISKPALVTYSGRITKAHSGFFTIHSAQDSSIVVCIAAGRLTKKKHTHDALAVGDQVLFERVKSEGLAEGRIVEVLPRVRMLARKDPIVGTNQRDIQQVIIANLDVVVFVFSCADPEFKSRMLDRYLVGAEAQQIPVIICATKVDLVGEDTARKLFADYERIGYRIVYVSTVTGLGIDELRTALHGKLSVLTGKSGVGKSSLLNILKPGLAREVGKLSDLLKKGKHTTVVPELFQLDEASWVADTPGLRAYAVWDVEAEELDAYFREIGPLVDQCGFSDCTHMLERGCAIRKAVEHGDISSARYDSYCRLREELQHQRKW
jgi:ribosome biogenesis GTPase